MPGGAAGFSAELFFKRLQHQRGAHFTAPALAEEAADQRGLGDHVGELPFFWHFPEGAVLSRHQVGVELGGVDVGVDAGDEFPAVFNRPRARSPVHRGRVLDLRFQVGFGVGRDQPLRAVHRAVAFGAARERGQFGAPGVAQQVHQEQPVLRARVARAEHHARARAAVDVGHAEGPVALDRNVRARAFNGCGFAFLDPECGVLEIFGNLRMRQCRRGVQEVGVQRQLVCEVRRVGVC